MTKNLKEAKTAFVKSFNIQDSPDNIADPVILSNVKKNFKINFNKDEKMIEVESKFNVEQEAITESLEVFEKQVEKKVQKFLDDFAKLKFYIKGAFSNELWIGHKNVVRCDTADGVLFKRDPNDASFNYFTALYTEPLVTTCVFKISVEAVYESDRFVDVGIMPQSKFDSTKNNFINSFNSGGISYCGYSISGGISGKYPTTSANSTDGLKPGDHFYFRYEPQKEIRFYNDSESVDLKKDMTGTTGNYYLFAVVYHPQTIYTISKIE